MPGFSKILTDRFVMVTDCSKPFSDGPVNETMLPTSTTEEYDPPCKRLENVRMQPKPGGKEEPMENGGLP